MSGIETVKVIVEAEKKAAKIIDDAKAEVDAVGAVRSSVSMRRSKWWNGVKDWI